jgi:hypothetical protein
MSRKPNHFNQVLAKLQDLHKKFPQQGIARHFSLALSDYGDFWGVSDKELLFALEKYEAELEMDFVPDKDLEKIIKEGENLQSLFNENEEEDDY